jgi:hypothetical protein
MNIKPLVVEELRALFREGSTPSRLIQHIIERHEGEQNCYSFIQAYFREAFGVDIVRGLRPLDKYQHSDLRDAFLNNDLLHEIVEKQSTWNLDANHAEAANASWLAGLTAKSIDEHYDKAAQGVAELGDLWNRLDPKEQAFIQRMVAGDNWNYEQIKILIRLAERLQQRVTELESQLKKEAGTALDNS